MRHLIASAVVSQDGYCNGANGEIVRAPWGSALGAESLATLDRCDALLYGRIGFLRERAFWHRPDVAELPMARLLRRYPKLVCSTTLDGDLGWSAVVIRSVDELAARRREDGKHLVVFGSPTLLARIADLVDELRMVVSPRPLGAGTPWFKGIATDGTTALGLPLAETRELASGVVLRCYRRFPS